MPLLPVSWMIQATAGSYETTTTKRNPIRFLVAMAAISLACWNPVVGRARVSVAERRPGLARIGAEHLRELRQGAHATVTAVALAGFLCIAPVELFSGFGFPVQENVAYASGLFQMPPGKLKNTYFLVRAGESEFEKNGVINTNPVKKTSLENGLSENGKKQALKAAVQLKNMGACEGSCWVWPSITQRAYQAAELIAYMNNVSRSRIVPEYSFLDARGLGAYEGKDLRFLTEVYETDELSTELRPPPYTDGTPNESVADVFVRVTQLMSILETQYAADNIVIVSPDSDNLSILQAGLYGLDLRRHSELAFAPGEVRLVDINSIPRPRAPVSGFLECPTPTCR